MAKKFTTDRNTKDLPAAQVFPFTKMNYMIIIAGIAIVILGFLLMMGGGSEDPNVFNEEELFSFRRITLAPLMVILGYVVVLYAILFRPKNNQ